MEFLGDYRTLPTCILFTLEDFDTSEGGEGVHGSLKKGIILIPNSL